MKNRLKRLLWDGARIVVCVVALAWVLNNITYYDYVVLESGDRLRLLEESPGELILLDADGTRRTVACDAGDCSVDEAITIERGLAGTVERADSAKLLLCVLLFAPVPLLQAWRLQLMLRAQEIDVTFWESVKLTYAGNFLNFVTPLGSTGGDVFKMYYVSLHTERKTEAVVTVVLDRIIGLYGLVFLVGAITVMRFGDGKLGIISYGIGGLAAGGLLAGFILFSERARSLIRPHHLLAKLPFAEQFQRAESATRRLGRHKRLVLTALLSALMLQFIAMTAFTVAAVSFGMRSDVSAIWDYYAYIAAGMVVAAIPISPQGLGTMEAFFKHMLLGSHGTLPAILCLAMSVRLITLLWSLPGVIVTMTGAYRPRITEKEVQFA